jgi:hypothetical protein
VLESIKNDIPVKTFPGLKSPKGYEMQGFLALD